MLRKEIRTDNKNIPKSRSVCKVVLVVFKRNKCSLKGNSGLKKAYKTTVSLFYLIFSFYKGLLKRIGTHFKRP